MCHSLKGFFLIWLSKCTFKDDFIENSLLRASEVALVAWKGFYRVWQTKCLFKEDFWENFLLHTSHTKGFSRVWVRKCTFKWNFWENPFLHTSHLKGFSLECHRRCLFKLIKWIEKKKNQTFLAKRSSTLYNTGRCEQCCQQQQQKKFALFLLWKYGILNWKLYFWSQILIRIIIIK